MNADRATIEQAIGEAARREGFVLVGFARLRLLDHREEFYRRWLGAERHADMTYLASDPERRFDPRVLDSRLRSVVSLAYPYEPPAAPAVDWRAELRGRIAAYALGSDYHDRMLEKTQSIAGLIAAMRPGAVTRCYVDTGPVFEREWAARIGPGMVRQKHQSAQSRTRFIFLPERNLHRYRIGAEPRAIYAIIAGRAADASTCARPARSPTAT